MRKYTYPKPYELTDPVPDNAAPQPAKAPVEGVMRINLRPEEYALLRRLRQIRRDLRAGALSFVTLECDAQHLSILRVESIEREVLG